MIFKAEPNHMVYDTLNKKHYFFDENGKFETENPSLIERMKLHFAYENNVKREEIKKQDKRGRK